MAHTNSTTNYHFPIFTQNDKPAWCIDFNSAMVDIDSAIAAVSNSTPIFTVTNTDPGEGTPLAANHFIVVYED